VVVSSVVSRLREAALAATASRAWAAAVRMFSGGDIIRIFDDVRKHKFSAYSMLGGNRSNLFQRQRQKINGPSVISVTF
jgi:hypothetical protein